MIIATTPAHVSARSRGTLASGCLLSNTVNSRHPAARARAIPSGSPPPNVRGSWESVPIVRARTPASRAHSRMARSG